MDVNSVKLDPQLNTSLDAAHKVLDTLIASSKKTLERNQTFLTQFELTYEKKDSKADTKKPKGKGGREMKRLDPVIVSKH